MTEALHLQRQFSSKDFAALRAFVQRLPPSTIARTYYDIDEDPHAATPGAMERYLRDWRQRCRSSARCPSSCGRTYAGACDVEALWPRTSAGELFMPRWLLLGDSGLRREEAAGARREALRPFLADDGTDV
ncbi:hypothetical protein LMG28688_06134 [Paraburkholderia caffeinitolerans]|uniref:Uncharacterized protein n=1 Tax=Paraburkholderia caffeinitolerans TaxID=1723730 RepID=A0A6J5GTW6_9BURK|nr:hypothetical protein [Paraburkholderia caffeinitolerans]CAB3805181.1 hypothetical protein LMG28688_06134 [Paraburkholderia caffeinitolerans]